MKNKTGKLIVISAPSGTGKTTVVKRLLEKITNIVASVSFTTRPKRENEREGIDYFFVNKKKFEAMVDDNQFIEHATVFGNYYGTQKESLSNNLKKGRNVILEIDWQGAQQVKEKIPSCIMIFLIPPSKEVLLSRLKNRGTDSENQIKNRFNQAISDLNESNKFDHVLVNDQVDVAVENIANCIEGKLDKINQSEMVDKAVKSFYETN